MNPNQAKSPLRRSPSANRRLSILYGLVILIIAVIVGRLFYLQVVRHDYYKAAALSDQLKQYSIAPERGIIEAYESGNAVPLVLNQKLYTVYADPTMIKNAANAASAVAGITHGKASDYESLMKTKNTRYVVLAKKASEEQSKQILALKLPGVGTQGQDYRIYPQGSLASQLLGFVNDEGKGSYGIEQALNKELSGTPGELKAITDANGVPLAASKDNIQIDPKDGDNIVLGLDIGMQAQMEKILASEYKATKSQGLSAVILDTSNGQIKAMANYPSYDPSKYQEVSNSSLFLNAAVDNAIEPGSTMKNLTTAAALDQGVIQPSTTFYDPAHWKVDGFNITDIEEDGGAGTKSIGDILNLSLNTGATWELMQMGGGKLDSQGRDRWHDYMVNHFQLGKATGVEQGYESAGYIPSPKTGYGLNLTYANTSFGQAVTITALQMAAALSSALNGGTYYQPHLVDRVIDSSGKTTLKKPVVVKNNVVSPKVSSDLQKLMEYVVAQHYTTGGFTYLNFPANYSVGGKTGTAQIANPNGGYYANKFNGTYAGFVGGDKPQYVIVVYNIQPGVPGYAGSYGGQPVFADLAHMLINDGDVTPKTGN
ncbi:MAG TPA: penicillin-binding protein 2 [Candidatus Saccharimonadales bacterium]|nr:penicillin-binding protein 2 [Candidatus Saccharimonadales bacterium]